MSVLTRAILGIVLLVSVATTAAAQSFSKDPLSDWEFRFYACKHVVMNAGIVVRLMAKHQITDVRGIEEMQLQLGPTLVKAVTENEKAYQFTESEAWFVSDLTFAVVSGVEGRFSTV